ncbi:alpha/beta fold hydrolase [Streptomyces sp. NPDC088400]|uniref:alpha/beta fold hydrolase n=1 Tax=Streptomyces sp. NPDC088400 TaxID=3365861 RepID=UPI00380A75FA
MGGTTAHLLARRHPELITALVVADTTVLNEEPETHPVLDVPARRMARARPGTELTELPSCGHWLHQDDPDGFARAVG